MMPPLFSVYVSLASFTTWYTFEMNFHYTNFTEIKLNISYHWHNNEKLLHLTVQIYSEYNKDDDRQNRLKG